MAPFLVGHPTGIVIYEDGHPFEFDDRLGRIEFEMRKIEHVGFGLRIPDTIYEIFFSPTDDSALPAGECMLFTQQETVSWGKEELVRQWEGIYIPLAKILPKKPEYVIQHILRRGQVYRLSTPYQYSLSDVRRLHEA